ncbi:MAG TPA: murein biosynthesis integral membrane protein MurJ [Candidatus Baltobacteraceae bacterium]|nr:murein biosynthesis integral membrane protein MurJ [Candidatus Baltobacteraceae bacterium]
MARTDRHLHAVPHPVPRSLAGSTVIVMSATLASTLLGFAREVVNARYFGTQWEMDTFLAAATVPTIIFGLFNGALVNALVPTFTEYVAHGRDEDAWRLANTILNGLFIVLVVGGALGWLLAPVYVPWIAHGFPAPQMGATVRMTRWMMPSIVGTSLAGVVAAVLNAHHRFGAAALQGVAINVVTIGTVVVLFDRLGIYALVLGTTLGLCAQLVVQLPAFFALGAYRPVLDLHHPGLRRMMDVLGPIVVGSAAGQIALFFDRFFASTLQPGYIAGINYATKLVGFPQQVFAAAIATVIFPLLASHFARANHAGVRRSIVTGLRLVMFIAIPATLGLVVLATPIVRTLFERGNFVETSTVLTAHLIPYAAVGLVASAANVVLIRCCFACRAARSTVAISVLAVVVNVVLSMIWLPHYGAKGLLGANAVSQGVEALLLGALVWRLLGGLELRALWRSARGSLLCSGAMVIALRWIAAFAVDPVRPFWAEALYLAGQLAIGGLAFFAVARLIGAEELQLVVDLIVRKFRSGVPSAAEGREAPIA